jgi:hypothetical protein
MQGTITGKHVVRHSVTIIRCWGLGTWVRCMRAVVRGSPCTFLAIAVGGQTAARR